MPIIARGTSRPFTPAPPGVHNSVCIDVVDLGIMQTPWGDKSQIEMRFQIDKMNGELTPPRPFMVVRRFTNSLNEKANLRAFLESWFGRELTEAEIENGIDVEALCLELPALLQIIHQTSSKGKVFANIKSIMTSPDGTRVLLPIGYVRVKDRTPEGTPEDDEIPF